MANVGEAVLAIVGDSKPFLRTLNNLDRTAGRSLDRVGQNMGERIGNATGRALKVGLVAAAGAAAAVAGVALVKGFQRFADIEDATAALTITLGDAAKAGDLLGNVLKVVEGTPFSFDQFATVAKNLAAMQIEASKIPRILTAIGEAGAATGQGAEGVNDVANALGRMATSATLSLEPVRALEEQGIPALTILANKFGVTTSRMAKDISAGAIDSSRAIDLLTDGILNGTTGVTGLSVQAEAAREKLESLGDAAETADERLAGLKENVGDVGVRLSDLQRDAQDAKEALDDALRPASAHEMESAILSVERSLNRQTDAAEELEDAQRDLNAALKDTKKTADEIARGALDEKRARLSVEEAIDRVKDAEQDLKKARKGGTADEIADAERDLRSARLSVEESQLNLNDAEREAKKLRDGVPAQADKIAAAEKRVRDARLAQREAAQGVIDSQIELTSVQQKGTALDERVADARERVASVTRQVADAERDLVKAQKEVAESEKDVAKAHKKVADAQKDVNTLLPETNKNTVALGGSMDALGKTTRGAMANLVTAVARAGANVFAAFSKAGGDTNVLATILTNLRDTVDTVGKKFAEVATNIAGSEGFAKVIKFFEDMPGKVDKALKDIEGKSFSEVFAGLVDKIDFGDIAGKVLDGFFDALSKVPVAKFSGVFTEIVLEVLAESSSEIVEGFVDIAPRIAIGVVTGLLKAFADHPLEVGGFIIALGLPGIGAAITGFLSRLPFVGMVAPLFRGLGLALRSGFAALGRTTLGTAIGVFGLNLQALLGNAVRVAFTAIAGVATSAAAALVGAILAGIAGGFGINWLLERLAPGVNRAIEAVGGALFDFFTALPGKVIGWLVDLPGNIIEFFTKLPGWVIGAIDAAGDFLFEIGKKKLLGFLNGIKEKVKDVFTFFKELPGKILEKLKDAGTWLLETGKSVVKGLKNGITDLVNDPVTFFKELPGKILEIFKDAGSLLFNVGKKIVAGLLQGVIWLIRRFPGVGNRIADELQKVFNNVFEIQSPSKVMFRIGQQIGAGLNLGIEDSIGAGLSIRTPSIGELQTLSRSGGGGFTGSGAVTQNFDLTVNQVTEDPRTTAFKVAAELGKRATR